MKITILTIFPEMFAPLHLSMLGRAEKAGLLEIREVNIRDYSKNKHDLNTYFKVGKLLTEFNLNTSDDNIIKES